MKLFVLLAAFGGCDPEALDDPAQIESLLRGMVADGGFTLFGLQVAKFEPQGVTAAAVVGESHIALHSWPEERRLFVDIASCTTEAAARRALASLRAALLHETITVSEIDYSPESGFVGR